MRRRLFNIAATLSLLLCVAVCALWVRSYWRSDQITWRHISRVDWLRTPMGHLEIGTWSTQSQAGDPLGIQYMHDQAWLAYSKPPLISRERGDKWVQWERWGFAWLSIRNAITGDFHDQLFVPFWTIASLLAVLPGAWVLARSRARRKGSDGLMLCPECGYDLRASPERCPECGASRRRMGIAA